MLSAASWGTEAGEAAEHPPRGRMAPATELSVAKAKTLLQSRAFL